MRGIQSYGLRYVLFSQRFLQWELLLSPSSDEVMIVSQACGNLERRFLTAPTDIRKLHSEKASYGREYAFLPHGLSTVSHSRLPPSYNKVIR